jgi:hypothetical protein
VWWLVLPAGAWLDEAGLVGGDYCLDAVTHSELGQDPGHVGAHGGFADHQGGGDLGVGQPAGDQPQYLDLPRGQFPERARAGP